MASVHIDRTAATRAGIKAVDGLVGGLARAARDHGREISPHGPTGRYARSWRARKVGPAWWRVGNVDFAAHIVEWGSVNNPAYRPMRQTIDWLRTHGQELL